MHVHTTPVSRTETTRPRRRGFSLTELLVVIGIIILLVGLLLVALGGVRTRAKRTDTEAIMSGFRQACEAFQLEHRFHPGLLPETVLAQNPQLITTTENALLQLMGGARVLPPNASSLENEVYTNYSGVEILFPSTAGDWRIKYDRDRLGEGPLIDGKPFPPYFASQGREVRVVEGQWHGGAQVTELPDLIDSWGQPIIYARRLRTRGPLVGDVTANPRPQFSLAGFDGFLGATELGEMAADQTTMDVGSILATGTDATNQNNFERLIRHPALPGEPRGAIVLFSAGSDGIFFAGVDGPGTNDSPITDLASANLPDEVLAEYDDIRMFGGG